MKTEYEVRILEIDVSKIQKKLAAAGARKIADRKMRRYVYDIDAKNRHIWIRLRDDGKKITLAVKEIHNKNIDGTDELEIEVSDFEKTNLLLNRLGFMPLAYQESKRISYKLDNVEIDIDFWPRIPAYLEIEGSSVRDIEKTVKKLGFKMSETTTDHGLEIFARYGINLHSIKELKFRQ